MADLHFLALVAKCNSLVLSRLCARDAFSLEELRELAKLLKYRQDAATAIRAVDVSMKRLEKLS